MKRVLLLMMFGGLMIPAAMAQGKVSLDHGQVGVYADYFRLGPAKTNFVGLGGRLSLNTKRWLQFEGEMNYDFAEAFTEGFTNPSTGAIGVQRTNVRVLHGLFGPKLQTTHGGIRPFVTFKGGFVNFRLDPRLPSFATFVSSVQDLRTNNVSGALYPGAGFEAHLGPVGVRLDVGDEIFFSNGAHHNPRVAFGPILRF